MGHEEPFLVGVFFLRVHKRNVVTVTISSLHGNRTNARLLSSQPAQWLCRRPHTGGRAWREVALGSHFVTLPPAVEPLPGTGVILRVSGLALRLPFVHFTHDNVVGSVRGFHVLEACEVGTGVQGMNSWTPPDRKSP